MESKSIIRQLFEGERGLEQIELTKECKRLLSEAIKNENELKEKLKDNPELLSLYEKTNLSIETMHSEDVDTYFIEGFKLGIAIGVECK